MTTEKQTAIALREDPEDDDYGPCCAIAGCTNVGTHRPVLGLVPSKDWKGARFPIALVGVRVCEVVEHQPKRADLFLTDRIWSQVLRAFDAMERGAQRPYKWGTEVEYVAIREESQVH